MRDVKSVTQVVYLVTVVIAVLIFGAAYLLRQLGRLRIILFRASILTLGLIAAIVIAAILNWNFFFTGFHTLFFEGGTWYFAYSDTLIRLFPEQFWFDAALTIGGLTTLEAVVVILITRFRSHHLSRNSNMDEANV
jgi:integral membrane protein (TIGR01906 family)